MNTTHDVPSSIRGYGTEPTPSSAEGGANVVQRVAEGAHTSIDQVQRVAEGAHASIDQVQRGVERGIAQARDATDQWSGSMREMVREHPLASVGGAFALGMVFARLLR